MVAAAEISWMIAGASSVPTFLRSASRACPASCWTLTTDSSAICSRSASSLRQSPLIVIVGRYDELPSGRRAARNAALLTPTDSGSTGCHSGPGQLEADGQGKGRAHRMSPIASTMSPPVSTIFGKSRVTSPPILPPRPRAAPPWAPIVTLPSLIADVRVAADAGAGPALGGDLAADAADVAPGRARDLAAGEQLAARVHAGLADLDVALTGRAEQGLALQAALRDAVLALQLALGLDDRRACRRR